MNDKKRRDIEVDFYFDIETQNWDIFVVGGVADHNGFHYYTDEDEFVDHILSLKGVGWAHNGGRYDSLLILQHILDRKKVRLFSAGQRLISIVMNDIEIRDSQALIPLPLSKASQIGGLVKIETGLPCVCGKGCGGYCSISRNMPSHLFKRLVTYLERDCIGGMRMLQSLIDYAEYNDLDLGSTIGGSAWRNAMRQLDLPSANWDSARGQESTLYKFARAAYFGGRTQVFRPHAERGWQYDINSAYPAALSRIALPYGERREVFGGLASKSYRDGKGGIYEACVLVPKMLIPPLPIRCKLRVAYPFGLLRGTWCANELQYAEELGCEIKSITRAVVWSDSLPVLKPWVEKIWKLRDAAGVKTALGQWLKWYANSLTGKLAQRPEREECMINPDEKWRFCPANGGCANGLFCGSRAVGCCPHLCTGECGRAAPIDREGRIWTRQVWRLSDCSHVHFAAYLTAATRITLHRQLVSTDGGLSAVYCDTDSVYSIRERTENIGNQLGQFKEEGPFIEFTAIAPKTYSYIDASSGEFVAKAKGIPDAARNFHRLREGVAIDRGVLSFKSAVRKGGRLFTRKNLWRVVNPDGRTFGDRILADDGMTHAQTFEIVTDGKR